MSDDTQASTPASTGEPQATREMPKYKCYKEVHALKIAGISLPQNQDGDAELGFEDRGYMPILMKKDWLDKHNPEVGGYYVVYKDGYKSFSPAEAFEDGYTLIIMPNTQTPITKSACPNCNPDIKDGSYCDSCQEKTGVIYETKPQRNSWKDVEDFRILWDFLPNDLTKLEKLSRDELINIAMCGMTVLAQGDQREVAIKRIKEAIK